MARMGEMTFMDLPDDILINIFKRLDLPTRLKLRLNKRLDSIQSDVKYDLKQIWLDMTARYRLAVIPFPRIHSNITIQSSDFDQLVQGFRRLALNTRVNHINICMSHSYSDILIEQRFRVAQALFNIEADSLQIHPCLINRRNQHTFPHLDLSTLLTLTEKVKKLTVLLKCTSISAHDLSILRQTILEGDCKMTSVLVIVEAGMHDSLVESCFGVTVETGFQGVIYRAVDESIQLHADRPKRYKRMRCFGNNSMTEIILKQRSVEFTVTTDLQRINEVYNATSDHKLILNHQYS